MCEVKERSPIYNYAVTELSIGNERKTSNLLGRKRDSCSVPGQQHQADMFTESAVSAGPGAARLQFAADFAIRVESEVTRTVQVSTDIIRTADDAAAVFPRYVIGRRKSSLQYPQQKLAADAGALFQLSAAAIIFRKR